MSYNHGLEEKKFKEQWQKTAEEYRKAGMTEKQIAEIYEFDREVFNSNRRYREKTVGLFDNSNSRTLTVYDDYSLAASPPRFLPDTKKPLPCQERPWRRYGGCCRQPHI